MNWRGALGFALKVVTVGLVARHGKLKPRDVIPGIVLAAMVGRYDRASYTDVVADVLRQIQALGFDHIEKAEAITLMGTEIQDQYGAAR